LEDVILSADSKDEERKRDRHRSSSSENKKRPFRRSRSRSLSSEVRNRERNQAATSRKEEVAKRPASFKSAISLQMPVGSSNRLKRTASPERQHVFVQNPAAVIEEDKR
jgi:hypothetical protein